MSDTPRTDAVWELFATDTTLEPDVEFSTLACQLERELNAANYEVQHLREAYIQLQEGNERQRQRIKRLEEALYKIEFYAATGILQDSFDEIKRIAKEDKL